MENPEEVLQALDEFEKLRPSEIPRELEDYLCFVAKTGDPVYQWSLIKPLFREKLVRVMTDFYETSPTLDLAPSPNIELFNYDSMKGNLLDLLESFANAPFTVQRICELLTSPRKEYNRVDKFMRAIEKNILVVSTREPGTAARRSENGDSMINGSMDEGSGHADGMEMESWVKDCATDNVLPDQDVPMEPAKSPKSDDPSSVIQEKPEARPDVNNFINSDIGTLNSIHEPSPPQNLAPVTASVSGIVGDVPEAIMNEDTSSQPSLDSESDDNDTSNTRKLQTTFQAKDFVDIKESKEEKIDESSEAEKRKSPGREASKNLNHQHPDLSIDEPIAEKRARLDDGAETIATVTSPATLASLASDASVVCPVKPAVSLDSEARSPESKVPEASEDVDANDEAEATPEDSKEEISAVPEPQPSEADPEPEEPEVEPEVEPEERPVDPPDHEAIESDFQELPEYQTPKITVTDSPVTSSSQSLDEERPSEPKPIIEEPPVEKSEEVEDPEEAVKSDDADEAEETGGVVIQEAMEDDTKVVITMVPDPIPIVEEPKDEAPVVSGEETTLAEIIEAKSPVEEIAEEAVVLVTRGEVIAELTDAGITDVAGIADGPGVAGVAGIEDVPEVNQVTEAPDVEQLADPIQQVETAGITEGSSIEGSSIQGSINDDTMDKEMAESMDVDSEDAAPSMQQDEPMEEECGDQLKS